MLAHFDAGLALATRDELEIVGEEGGAVPRRPVALREPGDRAAATPTGVERIEIEPVNSYGCEAENMSAAIRGEAPPLLGRDDAVAQARAIEALYEAADAGRAVTLG